MFSNVKKMLAKNHANTCDCDLLCNSFLLVISLSSSLSDVSSPEEVEEETLLVFNELDATERGVTERGVIVLGVLLEPRGSTNN